MNIAAITLAVLAVLTGTVRSWHDNRPIPHAQVAIRSDAGDFSTTTDASGRFTLLGIPPGKAMLILQARGFAPVSVHVCVRENEVRTMTLKLITGGSIPELAAVSRYDSAAANGLNPNTTADVYYVGC